MSLWQTRGDSNAVLHFYGRAYESILDDFIFNDDFGLVRFLSSEIRHGWLPNKIRSVLESFYLVTELGGDERYESNTYWREKLELTLIPKIIDEFDEVFRWFSNEVDIVINEANTWPQATRESNNSEFVFNFFYGVETLKDFRHFTKTARNGEDFFNLVTEFIWQKLELCFVEMRYKINQVLKPKFNALFDELHLRCSGVGVKLNQLHIAIHEAKVKTIEEIDIIEGWFHRPEYSPLGNVYFQDVLKVAIRNIRGIYNPREILFSVENNIDFDIEQSKVLPLIRALSTAFQNCIKHGNKDENGSDIKLDIISDEDGYQIIVFNAISHSVFRKAIDNETVDKFQLHIKESRNELLVTEGGTGLYKVHRFIKDAFGETSFNVKVDESSFSQIIKLRI